MYPIDLRTLSTPILFGRASQREGWDHGGRALPTHLWVFMMEGSAEFRVGDLRVTVTRGDSIFIPKETFYVPHTPRFADYYFFHFDVELSVHDGGCETAMPPPPALPYFVLAPEAPVGVLALPYYRARGAHSTEIEETLLRCERLLGERGNEARLLFELEFYRALVLSARDTEKAMPRALSAICAYIAERMREDVSLCEISKAFGYSPSYVARLFRVHLGTTVSGYRNDQRLGRAYRLLLDTDLRVGEIAETCGFSDIYYFSRLVKRRYGRSPRDLRRQHGV